MESHVAEVRMRFKSCILMWVPKQSAGMQVSRYCLDAQVLTEQSVESNISSLAGRRPHPSGLIVSELKW